MPVTTTVHVPYFTSDTIDTVPAYIPHLYGTSAIDTVEKAKAAAVQRLHRIVTPDAHITDFVSVTRHDIEWRVRVRWTRHPHLP